MAISRQTGFPVSVLYSTGVNAINVTNVQLGDILILTGKVTTTTLTVSGVSGGGVNTWTQVTSIQNPAGTGRYVFMWYGVVTATGHQTVTITYSSANTTSTELNVDCLSAYGQASVWSLISSGTADTPSPSTTPTLPSLTATNSHSAYVGYLRTQYAATTTPGGGYVYFTTAGPNTLVLNTPLTSSTAYSVSVTQTSGLWEGISAIFSAVAVAPAFTINQSTVATRSSLSSKVISKALATVPSARAITGKPRSVAQATTVTKASGYSKGVPLSTTQATSAGLTRRNQRIVSVSTSTSASFVRTMGRQIPVSQATSVAYIRSRLIILPAISQATVASQTKTLTRLIPVAVTQTQTATVGRSLSRSVSTSQPTQALINRSRNVTRSSTQSVVATLKIGQSKGRTLSVTQPTAPRFKRGLSIRRQTAQATSVTIRRFTQRRLTASVSQTPVWSHSYGRALTARVSTTASIKRAATHSVRTQVAPTVRLIKGRYRQIAVAQTASTGLTKQPSHSFNRSQATVPTMQRVRGRSFSITQNVQVVYVYGKGYVMGYIHADADVAHGYDLPEWSYQITEGGTIPIISAARAPSSDRDFGRLK